MTHRARIERKGHEALELISGTEIVIKLLSESGFAVILAEFDTLVLPLSEIRKIHVYETGKATA
jgi:hypothetical protein